MTYPRAPARITAMTSSAASETLSARNTTSGCGGAHLAQHLDAAAVRHVDVEQDDVRAQVRDPGDRLGDRTGLTDHRHVGNAAVQLGAHARAEQGVVVDEEHPHGGGRRVIALLARSVACASLSQ